MQLCFINAEELQETVQLLTGDKVVEHDRLGKKQFQTPIRPLLMRHFEDLSSLAHRPRDWFSYPLYFRLADDQEGHSVNDVL